MKQELLGLINQTDSIRRLAHSQNDYIPLEVSCKMNAKGKNPDAFS